MQLTDEIKQRIEAAEHKALATCCAGEINVVPVSVVRVVGGQLWLHDFFMDKTAKNVCAEPRAALALWSGLTGIQIKGNVEYQTDGTAFEEAEKWIRENFSDRTLRGLLVFTPSVAYDISPGETAGRELL
jgi:predicted pyridoxine 5'-phosphate oxidase superfamily flavin-nucleotide-binding protein